VWTDGAGVTLFEAYGPGMVSLGTVGPVAIADGTYSGSTAEDSFFGVLDPEGIVAIRLSNSILGPNLFGIEVDHVQFGEAGSLLHELPFVLDWEGDPLLEPVLLGLGSVHPYPLGPGPFTELSVEIPTSLRNLAVDGFGLYGETPEGGLALALPGLVDPGASFASLFPGWTPATCSPIRRASSRIRSCGGSSRSCRAPRM
jgi:hypothetical protein